MRKTPLGDFSSYLMPVIHAGYPGNALEDIFAARVMEPVEPIIPWRVIHLPLRPWYVRAWRWLTK